MRRHILIARYALLTVACTATWTLFVAVYFGGLLGLYSTLVESMLYSTIDVLAKVLFMFRGKRREEKRREEKRREEPACSPRSTFSKRREEERRDDKRGTCVLAKD